MHSFSQVLKNKRESLGLSTREFFERLGGSEKLKMTLRNYQLIESGKNLPSPIVLSYFFQLIDDTEKKNAVISFFSSLDQEKNAQSVTDFLLNAIQDPSIKIEPTNLERVRERKVYSLAQLKFLNENIPEMRFHKLVLLYEGIAINDPSTIGIKLDEMEKLQLIKQEGERIIPPYLAYTFPKPGEASQASITEASNYRINILKTYVSKEQQPGQKLQHAIQLVRPEIIDQLLDEFERLRNKIILQSNDQDPDNGVPFVYVAFARKLGKEEL